jgi:hypothetical protein
MLQRIAIIFGAVSAMIIGAIGIDMAVEAARDGEIIGLIIVALFVVAPAAIAIFATAVALYEPDGEDDDRSCCGAQCWCPKCTTF